MKETAGRKVKTAMVYGLRSINEFEWLSRPVRPATAPRPDKELLREEKSPTRYLLLFYTNLPKNYLILNPNSMSF
jgi:hypothetical protein